jgi:hypothetical protein
MTRRAFLIGRSSLSSAHDEEFLSTPEFDGGGPGFAEGPLDGGFWLPNLTTAYLEAGVDIVEVVENVT